jgi:hypothetical protein
MGVPGRMCRVIGQQPPPHAKPPPRKIPVEPDLALCRNSAKNSALPALANMRMSEYVIILKIGFLYT